MLNDLFSMQLSRYYLPAGRFTPIVCASSFPFFVAFSSPSQSSPPPKSPPPPILEFFSPSLMKILHPIPTQAIPPGRSSFLLRTVLIRVTLFPYLVSAFSLSLTDAAKPICSLRCFNLQASPVGIHGHFSFPLPTVLTIFDASPFFPPPFLLRFR